MKKNCFNLLAVLLIAVAGLGLSSCNDDDQLSQESILQKAEGIIPLTSGIGEWDAAYLTKNGYYCYKQNLTGEDAVSTDAKFSTVTYMPANGSDIVSIIATKADNLPSQMVTRNNVVYFSFPNDSILELVYDDGKDVRMLDSIAYSKADLEAEAARADGDAFKGILSATTSLLNKYPEATGELGKVAGGSAFAEILDLPYVNNDDIVGAMTTAQSGNFEFTERMKQWYDTQIKEQVFNTISLWTGKATFKVGGSSCTLSGSIFCPADVFNDYGTYGIICDDNIDDLTLDNAEYVGTGYQSENDQSFGVDFRGFKPNTTYYYRAYYKFNGSDHGNIIPKYGSANDQVIYDTTIKSFTTGDNILTVDVVMCIDVTGSMSGIINTVKRNAITFYDLFQKSCAEEGIQLSGLNAQVIAFRDKNVDTDWLDVSSTYSLPDEKSAFDDFVNSLYANGGGDTPESGLEALNAAFDKTDWGVDDGYHRQVVILWTDAPYLIGSSYSGIDFDALKAKWNTLPSGRRLILFAPNGTYDDNGGSWENLDGWTNLIHETDLTSGFNNFDYILKSIIGELTSKAKSTKAKGSGRAVVKFRPN